MESLLVWLNEKIPTTAGVQHVFRLPDGRLMRDVGEFQPGCQYVVSSVQKLIRNVDYGGKGANPWRSKKTSAKAGKITRADIRLIRDAKGFADENEAQSLGTASSKKGTPALAGRVTKTRVITVISNSHRSSREKVLVNPSTMQNFEDMLLDFTNLLVMSKPPVQTLYTARPPYKRVCSFSQLFREFKDHDTFIACGREFAPSELGNKREAPPSSNSSEDALNGVRGGGDVGGASGANMGFASPPEMDHRKPRKQFRRAEDRYQAVAPSRMGRRGRSQRLAEQELQQMAARRRRQAAADTDSSLMSEDTEGFDRLRRQSFRSGGGVFMTEVQPPDFSRISEEEKR
uniref:Doublecortin domain-containing protein n=1 Tax=Macrostomum lignano TaxID=282301 RepID=A0A1I8IR24_9PLAT